MSKNATVTIPYDEYQELLALKNKKEIKVKIETENMRNMEQRFAQRITATIDHDSIMEYIKELKQLSELPSIVTISRLPR